MSTYILKLAPAGDQSGIGFELFSLCGQRTKGREEEVKFECKVRGEREAWSLHFALEFKFPPPSLPPLCTQATQVKLFLLPKRDTTFKQQTSKSYHDFNNGVTTT